MGRIDARQHIMGPLNRLKHQDDDQCQDSSIRPVSTDKENKGNVNKQHQDVASRKEGRVEDGKEGKQEHPPQKAVSEILPFFLLVGMLYVEGKSEKHGKDGIRFSAEQGENGLHGELIEQI